MKVMVRRILSRQEKPRKRLLYMTLGLLRRLWVPVLVVLGVCLSPEIMHIE